MRRARFMMPLQVMEQALQPPHSVKRQSTVGSQRVSTLQTCVSLALPTAGEPHSSAILTTWRVRLMVPPPQDLEQGVHCSQSPQRPSWHCGAAQACVLQGCTSSLSCTWHRDPAPTGILAMCRTRVCWPPSHEQEHALHSCHSPHSQSSFGHDAARQACTWESSKLQPTPLGFLVFSTFRLRLCWATPQVAEHADHSCQSLTWQSCTLQGFLLQPTVSMRSLGHALPPFDGKTMIWRCRWAWPPPQLRSQASHAVHSETVQSTGSSAPQACVSSRSPWQNAPTPLA
mmetsp:Transcript_25648/g.77416  ORF Transcript_25648/g.77416 Transcript_25648/m.77416 type:complete len:286 (-) Transcript_25648:2545-3402(-)